MAGFGWQGLTRCGMVVEALCGWVWFGLAGELGLIGVQ